MKWRKPKDPDRPFADYADEEIEVFKKHIDCERAARAFVAEMETEEKDEEADRARAIDRAKIGLFIFEALGVELTPPVAARFLQGGEDQAAHVRFDQTLGRWTQQKGNGASEVRYRLRRIAGHHFAVDWIQLANDTKALEAEAVRLDKAAAKEAAKETPSQIVVERRRAFARSLREEAAPNQILLRKRGWKNANGRLVQRDFVLDLIEITQVLQPDMEIHARPKSTYDKTRKTTLSGLPGPGFPEFVEKVRAHLYDRSHVPEAWQRSTENAVEFWKQRKKARYSKE